MEVQPVEEGKLRKLYPNLECESHDLIHKVVQNIVGHDSGVITPTAVVLLATNLGENNATCPMINQWPHLLPQEEYSVAQCA